MTTIETMAKAAWENPTETVEPYDELDDGTKSVLASDMRAALRALSEIELPWQIVSDGLNAYIIADGTTDNGIDERQAFEIGVKSILRALAQHT